MKNPLTDRYGRIFRGAAPALFAAALAIAAPGVPGAQEAHSTADSLDLDALFSEDVVQTADAVTPDPQQPADPVAKAIAGEAFRIGGSFSGSASSKFVWNNLWSGDSALDNPESRKLSAAVSASLYFDARPDEDFRVHGSVDLKSPFTESGDIKVRELFADYSIDDAVFLRFGKSFAAWGTGYFFSPADVINIDPIDIYDPTAERAGPISFRAHLPLYGTQTNFYMYTIIDSSDMDFSTTALAAKAEFLLGSYEVGVGGYYRQDTTERAVLTLSGPLGNFDIFGEAVLARGSPKTFVENIAASAPPAYLALTYSTPADHRSEFYPSATIGFSYSDQNSKLSLAAQYYYNGEGYSGTDRDALVAQARAIIDPLESLNPAAARLGSGMLAGLLSGSGRQYAAASASLGSVFTDDLSLSLLCLASISDLSGLVSPRLSLDIGKRSSVSAQATFVFGGENGEYTLLNGGPATSLALGYSVRGAF